MSAFQPFNSGPIAVIDCFGILPDDKIKRYFELGCEVKGLGRGHMKRLKDEVQAQAATVRKAGPGKRPQTANK